MMSVGGPQSAYFNPGDDDDSAVGDGFFDGNDDVVATSGFFDGVDATSGYFGVGGGSSSGENVIALPIGFDRVLEKASTKTEKNDNDGDAAAGSVGTSGADDECEPPRRRDCRRCETKVMLQSADGQLFNKYFEEEDIRDFARRFKTIRCEYGFSQADVGAALGRRYGSDFSQTTISRFEGLVLSHSNMCKLRPPVEQWLTDIQAAVDSGISLDQLRRACKNGDFWPAEINLDDPDAPFNSNLVPPLRKRRKRTSLDGSQRLALDSYFEINQRPDNAQMIDIAKTLALEFVVVRVWFCNKRQKARRKDIPAIKKEEPDASPTLVPEVRKRRKRTCRDGLKQTRPIISDVTGELDHPSTTGLNQSDIVNQRSNNSSIIVGYDPNTAYGYQNQLQPQMMVHVSQQQQQPPSTQAQPQQQQLVPQMLSPNVMDEPHVLSHSADHGFSSNDYQYYYPNGAAHSTDSCRDLNGDHWNSFDFYNLFYSSDPSQHGEGYPQHSLSFEHSQYRDSIYPSPSNVSTALPPSQSQHQYLKTLPQMGLQQPPQVLSSPNNRSYGNRHKREM